MSWNMRRLIAIAAGLLSLGLMAPGPISAATLTVTDLGDRGAPGQLRTLINQAVSGDTIVIPPGTITLTGAANEDANASGDLDILKNLTIQGAGAGVTILDGGGIDRVFDIDPSGSGITVVMSGLTIRNGNPGAGKNGGGIESGGTLTLTNVTISGNTAPGGGGGINSFGTLTLTNVTISGNAAGGGGGGLFSVITATLTNVTVSNNTATALFHGGGIYNSGTLTLTNVTISDNTAGGGGGGLINTLTLTLTNVTISGNTAGANGGGLNNQGNAIATLTNVTVSSNTTVGPFNGGGISSLGTLTLTNVTITGNTAPGGAGIAVLSGTATLTNTIVQSSSGANCDGTITSSGHNLDSGSTCGFSAPGDLSSTAPLLGPLANNGGPTLTHALLAGSPAIDAVTSGCPPPATDQRGIARPQGAACDIGAYEFVPGSGGGPTGSANVPQILNVITMQGMGGSEQQTFLTTDPITAGATYYDPNPTCAGVAPVVRQLLFFNLEGQLLLSREDVTNTQIAPGSKYQALALTLAPGALQPGAYNLIFLVRDCTSVNIFVSGFYPIRVLTP